MMVHGLSGIALGIVFGAGLSAHPPGSAREIVKGSGPAVQVGDLVTVNFEVRTKAGKELAGTVKRGLPYTFVLGAKGQPAMWTQALRGLGEGGERQITVPPGLAFGAAGVPSIVPRGASLTVHVWLVRIRR